MIAQIRLEFNGGHQHAAMTDDGKWRCRDEFTREMLNALYPADWEDFRPSDGRFGFSQVHAVVEKYHGKILWLKKEQEATDRVY